MLRCKVLAENILRLVGGESNIATLVHCATRLRFTIVDKRKVKLAELAALDGVITVVNGSEQLQVVIGSRVSEVFHAFNALSAAQEEENSGETQAIDSASFIGRLLDLIAGIFTPLLGVMAAAGILKGLLSMAVAAGWLSSKQSTAVILHAASDSVFYFLPMLLAITCARKFDTNIFIAVAIAGALVYPTVIDLFNTGMPVSLFGLPVAMVKYTGTVMPIIFSVWLMSRLECFLDRHIHENVRAILTPFLLLTLIVPLTWLAIGPVGVAISKIIASLFAVLYNISPVISCALMAAAWPVLVMFGVHWGFVPLFINDISVMGQSFLKAAAGPSIFALGGALLAVMVCTRNKKLRSLAEGTFIATLFGISEPGIYGVTLKLKTPFICAVIAAAFGGAMAGYAKSSAIAMGLPGLLTLPVFFGEGFIGFILGCAVAFLTSLGLTLIVGFDERAVMSASALPVAGKNNVLSGKLSRTKPVSVVAEQIIAPVSGQLISLAEVNDGVFSTGIVGPGFAIIPDDGLVYSPVDGYIASTFSSGHAIGICSNAGAEILIHVGINTVQLAGRYFSMQVKEGDVVKQGQLLLTFDVEAINAAGYDTVTPVIIANSEAWSSLQVSEKPRSRTGDTARRIIPQENSV
ncbi:beta-glucoside-specific PTS transporter subunit IIABC [Kosakonia sp. H02]|nr:beta-glucoside-specific PTS transporter subunit IIABC [Kosakonia sp. H02]